jgi:hypothetical protein
MRIGNFITEALTQVFRSNLVPRRKLFENNTFYTINEFKTSTIFPQTGIMLLSFKATTLL